VYFDNAATSQKPQVVIDSIVDYYSNYNANIHRGVHTLSQVATDAYELSRQKIKKHFNAAKDCEIIFTSGCTHGINIVASGFSSLLKKGDEIIVSAMEHHSNIVPWQMLCEKTGALLKVIPMNQDGELIISEYENLLSNKTKLVFVNHVSNALGTINPIKEIIDKVVTNRTKALYDPIADDAKRNVTRDSFKESMRSDIEAMTLNEYNGSQELEKFIVNRSYLRANDLAERLGIESQEDGGIKKDVDAAKDVVSTVDTQSIDRSGTVERGQATFDQLDMVDDKLILEIESELDRELKHKVT